MLPVWCIPESSITICLRDEQRKIRRKEQAEEMECGHYVSSGSNTWTPTESFIRGSVLGLLVFHSGPELSVRKSAVPAGPGLLKAVPRPPLLSRLRGAPRCKPRRTPRSAPTFLSSLKSELAPSGERSRSESTCSLPSADGDEDSSSASSSVLLFSALWQERHQ